MGRTVLSNMLWLEKSGLSDAQQEKLKRNYTLEGKPRIDGTEVILKAYSDMPEWLGIPRQSYGAYPGFIDQTICPKTNWPALKFPNGGNWRGNQEEVVDKLTQYFQSGKYGARLEAPCGSGKGQLLTAKILTPMGWKQFKDLKIKDEVIDPDTGCACEVTGIFPRGEQPTFIVTFSDRTTLQVDSSHLWFVQSQSQRWENRGGEVVSTQWLSGQELKDAQGRSRYFIPLTKPIQFTSSENLKLDPYLLGTLLGDGSISTRCVSFTNEDLELVEAVTKICTQYACRVTKVQDKEGWKCPQYNIANNVRSSDTNYVFDCLNDYGLIGRKSETKFIPKPYLFSSFSDRVAILQGLFDTDGYAAAKGACEYCTVSTKLRDQVEFLVRSLGGTVTTTLHQKCKFTKFQAYRLLVKLSLGVPLFRLTRKLTKSQNPQRGPFKSIIKIEKAAPQQTVCVSVSSKRSLYITDNFTVTHNTALSLAVAARLGVPAIILVHKQDLAVGWHTEATKFFPGAILGHVQGDQWNYVAGHATTCLVQTLWHRRGNYPKGFLNQFGMVIVDEGHRFSSQTFEYVFKLFPARYRLAVSATWRRNDELDAWDYHVGPKVATCHVETMVGRYVQVNLDFWIKGTHTKMPMATIITRIGQDAEYNEWLSKELVKAVHNDRKVVLLSDRIEQLKTLQVLAYRELQRCGIRKTVSLYIGEKSAEEKEVAKKADIILGTYQALSEGTNIPALDTLIFGTPRSDVEQCVGRIQRVVRDKKSLLVVDPVLFKYGFLKGMAIKRAGWMEKLGFRRAQVCKIPNS